ncbi:hypothetical protein [Streptomyces filamentosus]|uniref:hypothetical protein n=1 Tax=Streptomyces filamentosus TaxID=67294 RepID=UPI003404E2EB
MTKSGHDHLKRRARQIARDTGRRFPDVLAELRGESRPAPSKELVLLCAGLVHPLDGGRCARPASHRLHDRSWGDCSLDPHHPAHVWEGYHQARYTADSARHEEWLASLTPMERADYEAENEAEYLAQMAADAAEPYDPYEDKYRYDDPDEHEPASEDDGYGPEDEYDEDEYDDGADCDGDRW